jgi:hypothetical protein
MEGLKAVKPAIRGTSFLGLSIKNIEYWISHEPFNLIQFIP